MKQLTEAAFAGADDADAAAWAELCAVRRLQWERAVKSRLEAAVEQFNEDYKKGFQLMQARCRRLSCFVELRCGPHVTWHTAERDSLLLRWCCCVHSCRRAAWCV